MQLGHGNMKTTLTLIIVVLNTLASLGQTKSCDYQVLTYPDGKKKAEGCFVNKKREGQWKEYYENGYVYHCNYTGDVKSGPYKIFYSSGELRSTGFYKNDTPVDTFMTFSKDGKPIAKVFLTYIKPKVSNVTWRHYYDPNAKPDCTFEQKDGKTFWWQMGELLEFKLSK